MSTVALAKVEALREGGHIIPAEGNMKKSKPNPKKEAIVAQIKEKLSRAKAFFLTDYRGLTHKQLEQLRKALKKTEAEYSIVKNTLLKKSLEQADTKHKESFYEFLRDSTAALFAYKDPITSIKTLYDFAKSITLPKVKIGLFDGKILKTEEFNTLATLPSKEVLLQTLVFRLKSPIYGFHYALQWNLQKLVIALNNIKNNRGN